MVSKTYLLPYLFLLSERFIIQKKKRIHNLFYKLYLSMEMEIEPKEIVDISSDRSDTEEGIAEKTAEEVEEIFIKEPKEPPKRKYKLTDGQLEGLRKGREKMKEKRKQRMREELKKELEAEKAEPVEMTEEPAKKQLPKPLAKIRARLEQRETINRVEKRNKFNSMKMKVLENMKTVKEFDELSELLEEINDEDISDDNRLKKKLNDLFKRVVPEKSLL